jgi:hypothetical protein
MFAEADLVIGVSSLWSIDSRWYAFAALFPRGDGEERAALKAGTANLLRRGLTLPAVEAMQLHSATIWAARR